ncbi:type II toxin-antitoxin system RelE/ParE family toxin [Bacterioplanoides sp.]|uniref:type II toxin-antitoxin system RelE/ParE family toxin n=1 Tax=Bacterioplanoides sp. TaxID=2066072 RepID=UPI003AFFDA96
MKKFRLSKAADADMRKIAEYSLRQWGKKQQRAYIGELFDAFGRLAETPQIAAGIDNVRSGYKKFPQGSHIIFFRITGTTDIEVIRVLHKNMDIETQIISYNEDN